MRFSWDSAAKNYFPGGGGGAGGGGTHFLKQLSGKGLNFQKELIFLKVMRWNLYEFYQFIVSDTSSIDVTKSTNKVKLAPLPKIRTGCTPRFNV